MKIAFYSGGKESVYAALLEWPIDALVFLIYDFPRSSPHIANLGFAVGFGSRMAPVVVHRLPKGREFEEKARLLRKLGVDVIVAGDVDVEDHLRYMEKLAGEVGASLKEPLWGMDHEELLRREAEELSFYVIGGPGELLCRRVDRDNVEEFIALTKRMGVDPLGERGEYHSQVVEVRSLGISAGSKCVPAAVHGGYHIAEVRP